jgi:hypothetical protein
MNEPHLRSATAVGVVPAVVVDRLKRQEENGTKGRITDRLPKGVSVGSACSGCGKSIFRVAVAPQRLKPALNRPVIAAVNRCATQNQLQHRLFPQVF